MKKAPEVILEVIIKKTVEFFKKEFNMERVDSDLQICALSDKKTIYPYTAMIGIGGTQSLMFAMSFEHDILLYLAKAFIYGQTTDEEIQEHKSSVACEIANIVLGHAIIDMPNDGKGITITPPVMIENCQLVSKTKSTLILSSKIVMPNGVVNLAIISNKN